MGKLQQLLKNPYRIFSFLAMRGLFNWLPDKPYLKLLYRSQMGKKLNLKNPKTFNEKLQWMKLYDRNPEYIRMVDKYEAKRYVADIIGEEYIIPTLGVWDRFDDIDFDALPDQFVLKCTHDSGGLVICKDKSKLDIAAAKKRIETSLKRNYFWMGREWPYKEIPPRIICEQFLENEKFGELRDYKVQCFDGIIDNVMLCEGRFSQRGVRYHYFDRDWKYLPYCPYDNLDVVDLERLKPETFSQMVWLAETLSKGLPQVRVDLYEVEGKVYFGELTFFSQSGFDTELTEEADRILGSKMQIQK